MEQQTAVEWFYQRILAEDIKEIFEQAKAMEKQNLKEMYLKGIENYDPTFKRKSNDTQTN
jgi:hypothetical protein